MSVQSTSAQNGYIWENKELNNVDATSICFVNKKFVNDPLQWNECIAEIQSKTHCTIVVHDHKSDVIWFCIKHESKEQRQLAFDLINKAFNQKLNEVKLPKLIQEEPREDINSFRLSSPSPPPSSILNQSSSSSLTTTSSSDSKSPKTSSVQIAASTRKETTNQQTVSKKSPVKSSMTRSSTEGFISSLSYSKSSFTSNFRDEFTNRFNQQQQLQKSTQKLEKLKLDNNSCSISSNTNRYKLRNRYTVDFLLQRADTVNSKKQPSNWKELSEKYPGVCFSGKVISYFDPYKYHEHWEKTKKQNSELHNNESSSSLKYSASINSSKKSMNGNGSFGFHHHTDDFLNLNSFNSRDMNNNFYNFKQQNRMTMIHPSEAKLKRFESLNYSGYSNNASNQQNDVYFIKKQQQHQHDLRDLRDLRHGYDGLPRKQMSKTHSNYNFNN